MKSTKVCCRCQEEKEVSEFHNAKKSTDGKASCCSKCFNRRQRKVRGSDKERVNSLNRKSWKNKNKTKVNYYKYKVYMDRLLSEYNLNEDTFRAMMDNQQGVCCICKESLYKPTDDRIQLCVDHNHGTGEVRGLLCMQCNVMLGAAKDNPDILMRGLTYLMSKGSDS